MSFKRVNRSLKPVIQKQVQDEFARDLNEFPNHLGLDLLWLTLLWIRKRWSRWNQRPVYRNETLKAVQ